jgi:cytochrome P450
VIATLVERSVELALLGLIAFPLARLVIDPGVRRRFQAFPRVQVVLSGSLALYACIVAIIAVAAPSALRPAAIAALVLLTVERWQARAKYGLTRGLAPGSLAFMAIAPWRDPDFYRKQAARHGPVFKFRHFVYPAIGIVDLNRAGKFLASNEENLKVPPAPFNDLVPGGFVRYLQTERHQDVASLLRAALTPAVVDACEATLATEAKAALQTLAADPNGKADPVPVIDRMVLHNLMRCFFGISPGAQLDRLERHYRIADYRRLARTGRSRAATAVFDIVGELRATFEDGEQSNPGGQSFLAELCRTCPDALGDIELMSNFVYTLHTARVDVCGFILWLLVKLGENPSWVARLASELEFDRANALRPGGLADRIVRETLRLHQSEFLLRRVARPIQWDGLQIPSGWYVRVCVQESHRSSEMFDRPDVFDPDRFLQPAGWTRYSPFGLPPRICPGAHLSRAIGRHVTAELAGAYTIEVRDAEPVEFGGFHWKPSSRLRATLQARA